MSLLFFALVGMAVAYILAPLFHKCMEKIPQQAVIWASTVGLLGTVCMGLSTFAYLAGMTPAFMIAAVPGFLGWIIPFFLYQGMKAAKERAIAPKIEEQHENIYGICKSGNDLLHAS